MASGVEGRLPDFQLQLSHLTRAQGLSNLSVKAIAHDQYGFIWLGTADGLNRFDGYHMVVYRHQPDDPSSLIQDSIDALLVDRKGRLWAGTLGGLDRYDPQTDTFHHYPPLSDQPNADLRIVHTLHEDRQGTVWVGSYAGLGRYDAGADRFELIDLSAHCSGPGQPIVRALTDDRNGNLWIGTTDDGLLRLDLNSGDIEAFRHRGDDPHSLIHNHIRAVHEDRSGDLWIGTHRGLARLRNGRFTRFQHRSGDHGALTSDHVDTLFEDSEGILWIGTDGGGLNLFDRETETFSHFLHDRYDERSLPSNVIRTITQDRQGDLWIGTYNGGAGYFNRKSAVFNYRRQGPSGLSHDSVLSFFEDVDGTLWIGTEDGLNHFDPALGMLETFRHDPDDEHSLSARAVLSVHRDTQGRLWAGTYFGGLNRPDSATGKFHHFPAGDSAETLSSPHIWNLFEDSSGRLWIGSFNGANRFDEVNETFIRYLSHPDDPHSLPHPTVWKILEDDERNLWFATYGGLSLYDPITDGFRTIHHPKAAQDPGYDRLLSMSRDRRGRLWLAGESGLSRFDPSTETFETTYTADQGLAGNIVQCSVQDSTGTQWVTTNNGLSRLDPGSSTITNFDFRDGLLAEPFSKSACLAGRTGRIYVGGVRGFNSFLPEDVGRPSEAPPVVLTDFRIFNQSMVPGPGSPLQKPITTAEDVVLDYRQSIFSFHFAALDYRAPDKNRYAYRLVGFDDTWVDAGPQRSATFTSLAPGSYAFQVKGAGSTGTWNEIGHTIRVHVRPPFWGTPWFRALVALSLMGAVLGTHSVRTRSIRRHNQELQAEIDERRKVEAERQRLLENMETMVAEKVAQVTVLQGMLPICASCKKIRDDQGYWADVEVYIDEHSEASFSHGLCPPCAGRYAEELGIRLDTRDAVD